MIVQLMQVVAQVLVALLGTGGAYFVYRSFVMTVRRVAELERRVRRLEKRGGCDE